MADGFQRMCNWNMLIFRCPDFRDRCVCDSIKFFKKRSKGTRFGVQAHASRRVVLSALADGLVRQDVFLCSSRRLLQFVKSFLKKLSIFLKMLCQVLEDIYCKKYIPPNIAIRTRMIRFPQRTTNAGCCSMICCTFLLCSSFFMAYSPLG